MEFNLIATCAFGLEGITAKELRDLGYEDLKNENGRVNFTGDEMDIAIANVHLRTAERVLIRLAEFKAESFEELFQGTKKVDFASLIPLDGKMHVTGKSIRSKLHSVPDCQSIVKKAVVEKMKETYPVDRFSEDGPVFKIDVGILKDVVTLTLDTSGVGLHKRGYREHSGAAPLKETLAAALVLLSGYDGSRLLIDPMCGSGTILIEAALIARNMAPNAGRSFVSETWPFFPKDLYEQVREGARQQKKPGKIRILGYDHDSYVLSTARMNAKKAGVFKDIFFAEQDYLTLNLEEPDALVITNPPYGERIGERALVEKLTEKMGRDKNRYPRSSFQVLTAYEAFEKTFGSKAHKNRKLYNGRIQTYFYQYFGEDQQ